MTPMRRTRHWIVAAVLLSLLASPVAAASLPIPLQTSPLLQVDQMEFGAGLWFYTSRTELGVDVKDFTIRPTIGYFLADRWELQVGFDYEEMKRNQDVTRTRAMLIGPMYYTPLTERILGYLQGDVGTTQSVIRTGGVLMEGQGMVYDLGVGIKWLAFKDYLLDVGVRWMRINEAVDRDRIDLHLGGSVLVK
jgi:hypothetical protein